MRLGGRLVDLAVAKHDAVVPPRGLGRDVTEGNVARHGLRRAVERVPVPAPARGADDEDVAGAERVARDLARQGRRLDLATVAAHGEAVRRAPARGAHSVGRGHVLVREHREPRPGCKGADLAVNAESASPPAGAAGVAAKCDALDAQRRDHLDRLDRLQRRDVALGEVAHRIVAVPAGEGAGASGGKLDEEEVAIPAGIRPGHGGDVRSPFQIADETFGDRLAEGAHNERLEGAAHLADGSAGGGRARVHDGAQRCGDPDRAQCSRVDRPRRIEERLRHRERRGGGGSGPQVRGTEDLGSAAGEVGVDLVAGHRQLELQEQRLRGVAAVVEVGLVAIRAVREPPDRVAHAPLGPIEECAERLADGSLTPLIGHGVQVSFRDPACALHRTQIPAAIVGSANVREQEVEDLLDGDPAAHDPQRRDAYALLVDLRCVAGEAARHHAADVLPVRHHCHDREGTVVVEHRVEEPHVVEVRASRVGVVVQVQVARADVVAIPREHLAGRPRQGGDVGRLLDLRRGHELAGGGEHRRREVVALDDHVGVRGADDHGAHLAHDRREPRLDQLDGDGVEPARLDAGGPVGRAGGNRLVHASRTTARPAAAADFSPATSRQARRKTSASAL